MKTLAVLSALATIAIAAPAFEDYIDSTRFLPRDFTITQREKKSTQSETQKIPEHLEDHVLNTAGPSNPDARTFSGLKKPVIVKKKIGYHVYRDSGEDKSQANSQENCRKEKKVTICDDNLPEKPKGASIDHLHEISESKMEHSINIAKEAVHTFERDLQQMEHDCAENNKHRHSTLGSDVQLHHDIEQARLALEHIHRKFKNFDAVKTGEESISNVHSKLVKSDEERMIQWKAGNLHNNVEVGRNLEDNFKSTSHNIESKDVKTNNFNVNGLNDLHKKFKTTIEDIDVPSTLKNKVEDDLSSIIEDKNRKLEIHSDSLIKSNTENNGQQKEEKLLRMDHHAMNQKDMTDKHSDHHHNHDNKNHNQDIQATKERVINGDERISKLELKENDLEEKHTTDQHDDMLMLKSIDGSSASDNHARTKLEKGLPKGHLHTTTIHENDQTMHESNKVNSFSSPDNKKNLRFEESEMMDEGTVLQTDNKKASERRTSLSKDIETINHSRNDNSNKVNLQQMDLQHSTEPKKSEVHNLKNEDGVHIDSHRSIMAISKLDDQKNSEISHFNSHMENHANNDFVNLRATTDHKEILNNMDFVEDSHHMLLHQPSLSDKSHMMKNEKQELHERLNVPGVHSNNLKTRMHFSDNSHQVSSHLKMDPMFNNEEPHFNVQFNAPHDFAEQTNIQELVPFRSTGDLHDNTHQKDDIPTELHDPLKVHRAHSDVMRMDGSSQHFNIDKLTPARTMNDHHMSLNEQIRAQQQWAQGKNVHTHQLSPTNAGFEHLHAQDTLQLRNNDNMMFGKSNLDNTVQPNSFTHMRATPKMELEYYNPNQWAHNHGSFRSSYGPAPSYGGGSSGGSAVGVFPNANVGNSAVPILLSCSPSVVSGSLAKTQNAYSAPSYRSEDINFLKKRGVHNEATQGLKFRDTPLGHRLNEILENNNNTIQ